MSRTITATRIHGRRPAADHGTDAITHRAVRTVSAAQMARMKRATRRDLASMRRHPLNPWLDVAIKTRRLEDPVHWRLATMDSERRGR